MSGGPFAGLASAELERRAIQAYAAGAPGAGLLRDILAEMETRRDAVAVTLLPLLRQWAAETEGMAPEPDDPPPPPREGWWSKRARSARPAPDPEVAALRDALARKTAECERLARDLAAVRERPRNSVHATVHLSDAAPAWAVAAMRKAFRARYHPDRWRTEKEKAAAERVFKAAEAAFETIERAG